MSELRVDSEKTKRHLKQFLCSAANPLEKVTEIYLKTFAHIVTVRLSKQQRPGIWKIDRPKTAFRVV